MLLMFFDKYIKILLITLVFLPFKSFAQDSSIDVSGSVQTGYNLYDNYSLHLILTKTLRKTFHQ